MRILRYFVVGIVKRWWAIAITILADPPDLAERYFNVNYSLPQGVVYLIVGLGLTYAIFRTYLDYINKKRLLDNTGIIEQIRQIPETLSKMNIRLRQLKHKQSKRVVKQKVMDNIRKCILLILRITEKDIMALQRLQKNKEVSELVKLTRRLEKRMKMRGCDSKGYEEYIIHVGAALDNEGIGLKEYIENDKEYTELESILAVQSALLSKKVGNHILRYKRYSYGINSINLMNDYRVRLLGRALPLAGELVVNTYNVHGEATIMNNRRDEVSKAINKYLEVF